MRYWTEEMRRERAASFLAGVRATRKAERPKKPRDELSAQALNVLIKAALEPTTFLLDIYRALGLHGAAGKSAQQELTARGLIRLHRIVRKGRGAQPQVMEVTETGVVLLQTRGITPAKRLVKGGYLHDCYARLIGRWAERQGFRVSYERTMGQKVFDLTLEEKDGSITGVEVCLSGSAELNGRQLIKAAEVAGVKEVLGLCETVAFSRSVQKVVKAVDAIGLYEKKLRVGLLADYIGEVGVNQKGE
ncbi:MAG: hypothetical protein SF069_11800 [Phycisphaerae bacterium]|nr:hypothetical protein [Phycisphaerae bacterium]